jgi:hypothetical protein
MSHQFKIAAIAYAMLRAAVQLQEEVISDADVYFLGWRVIAQRIGPPWTELEVQQFIEQHEAELERAISPAWRLELGSGGVDLFPKLRRVAL